MATNKDILEQIEDLRKKIPNGEITLLTKAVEDLQISQKDLKEDIRDLKKQLLDPDDGVVVRVNKNSENRRYWEARNDEVEGGFAYIRQLMNWKDGVNRALWILFSVVVSMIIKLAFFNG
jgi:hypothetical protein